MDVDEKPENESRTAKSDSPFELRNWNSPRSVASLSYDLEPTFAMYHGLGRVQRLLAVVNQLQSDTPVRIRALELLIQTVRTDTLLLDLYEDLCQELARVAPGNPLAKADHDWLRESRQTVNAQESELNYMFKSYQANQHMGRDIGEVLNSIISLSEQTGQLSRAVRFSSTRRDENSSKLSEIQHLVLQCRSQVLMLNFPYLRGLADRALAVAKTSGEASFVQETAVASALTHMGTGEFGKAASLFLTISSLDETQSHAESANMVSARDMGIYIGLTALASLNRQDLQYLETKDTTFANYTEDCVYIRQLVSAYNGARYGELFELWHQHDGDFQADPFLAKIIDDIRTLVFDRALVQYLTVYSVVGLDILAADFGPAVADVQDLLAHLERIIYDYRLPARIDFQTSTLSLVSDTTLDLYSTTHELARSFVDQATTTLLAMDAAVLD